MCPGPYCTEVTKKKIQRNIQPPMKTDKKQQKCEIKTPSFKEKHNNSKNTLCLSALRQPSPSGVSSNSTFRISEGGFLCSSVEKESMLQMGFYFFLIELAELHVTTEKHQCILLFVFSLFRVLSCVVLRKY